MTHLGSYIYNCSMRIFSNDPDKLLIGTRNKSKKKEMGELLSEIPLQLVSLVDMGIDDEVEEYGQTFEENAILKAEGYGTLSGLLTLADDSGIEVDALGGRPGVFSARYAGLNATDEERNKMLMSELVNVPDNERTARFRCVVALWTPKTGVSTYEGKVEGLITRGPRGNNGFGYDPIFFSEEMGKTLAQIPATRKHRISHRGKAMEKAKVDLMESLKGPVV